MNKKVPEILALYLPQFHQIPENDLWWGKGFTEWTAVRNAVSLFPGHNQPRYPLDHNYYDLLEYNTMKWQADLARKYHIGGFCFYHYWFGDGEMILQKPAENLLGWKDITMPFCFCWANETWCRTWSNIKGGNVWSGIYEEKSADAQNSDGVLLLQKYGREEQWERHFLYLYDFFVDDRYIKLDGKPVIMIYKPDDIPCLYNMVRHWRKIAEDKGMPGIYVIGMGEYEHGTLDALCVREPYHAFGELMLENPKVTGELKLFDYSNVWGKILAGEPDREHYYCAVTDHDTTPRKGIKGECIVNASPELFRRYFKLLVSKGMEKGHRFLFMNAWNEWGEGMYLEPDIKTGYAYLDAVKQTVEEAEADVEVNSDMIKEMSADTLKNKHIEFKDIYKSKEYKKISAYFHLMEQWLSLLEKGIGMEQFFLERNIKRVAVYGVGIMGAHLAMELTQGGLEVICGIDMGENRWELNIPVVDSWERIPLVDAVVVTPFLDFGHIANKLEAKLQCPILSIREIICELL